MEAENTEKLAPFPWIVQFMAAMLVVSGAMGLCEMVYKLVFFHGFVLELAGVFNLLLGYFLFRRSESAYLFMNVFLVFALLGGVIFFLVTIGTMFSHGSIWIPSDSSIKSDLCEYFGAWWGIVSTFILIFLLLFLWYVVRVWHRPETFAIFSAEPKPKGTGNWASVLIVLGVILGVSCCSMDYKARRAISQMYDYQADFHVVDSQTKEPISDGLGVSMSPVSYGPWDEENNFGFRPQAEKFFGKDGPRIVGKSIEPVEVKFTAEGYKPATVVIEPGEKTYTVEMERKK